MMCCGQETTTVPMRRNEGACCHAQKLPSLDLRRTMPGKDSNEERIFKGLDCATPDPHLCSDYTLAGMRARCCTSDWKWGDVYSGDISGDCKNRPRRQILAIHPMSGVAGQSDQDAMSKPAYASVETLTHSFVCLDDIVLPGRNFPEIIRDSIQELFPILRQGCFNDAQF